MSKTFRQDKVLTLDFLNTYKGQLTDEDINLLFMFVNELEANGLVKSTISGRFYDMITIRKYIKPFTENTKFDLMVGISKLKASNTRSGKPYKILSINKKIISLKVFYKWLIRQNLAPKITLSDLSVFKPLNNTDTVITASQILDASEITQLIDACSNYRDKALLSMLYEGGFRISEICELTWSDVKIDEYGIVANTNSKKRGKPRYVRMMSSKQYLTMWKSIYPNPDKIEDGTGYIFLSRLGGVLSYDTVRCKLQSLQKKCNISKNCRAHVFRHSRITHAVADGMDEAITKKLFWGNMSTTMIATYAHLTNTDIDNAVLKESGIITKEKRKKNSLEPIQCINCFGINPPTAKYCAECGKPLGSEEIQNIEELKQIVEKRPDYEELLARLERLEKSMPIV